MLRSISCEVDHAKTKPLLALHRDHRYFHPCFTRHPIGLLQLRSPNPACSRRKIGVDQFAFDVNWLKSPADCDVEGQKNVLFHMLDRSAFSQSVLHHHQPKHDFQCWQARPFFRHHALVLLPMGNIDESSLLTITFLLRLTLTYSRTGGDLAFSRDALGRTLDVRAVYLYICQLIR